MPCAWRNHVDLQECRFLRWQILNQGLASDTNLQAASSHCSASLLLMTAYSNSWDIMSLLLEMERELWMDGCPCLQPSARVATWDEGFCIWVRLPDNAQWMGDLMVGPLNNTGWHLSVIHFCGLSSVLRSGDIGQEAMGSGLVLTSCLSPFPSSWPSYSMLPIPLLPFST